MTRCGICGQPCVPLADYDAPTCAHCDAAAAAITARVLGDDTVPGHLEPVALCERWSA